jgi:POT family proton-dependent oligopeptide transporter
MEGRFPGGPTALAKEDNMETKSAYPSEQRPAATNHPSGLYLLFVTEMWERFSYYGMRAIFTLYMINGLLFDKSKASRVYGSYTGLVYLTPLLGGYVADRFWGNRRSIIAGGLLMAVGQFCMFLSGSFYQEHQMLFGNVDLPQAWMFVGLAFLIFGNGFFKPNISTMVGQLYPPGDRRVDAAFTIFYMGINLGAFLAPLVCGALGERYNSEGQPLPGYFRWGFLAACVGMLLSVAVFVAYKNRYIVTPEGEQIGVEPNKARDVQSADATSQTSLGNQIIVWSGVFLILAILFYYGFAFGLSGDPRLMFTSDFDYNALISAVIFAGAIAIPGFIISDKSLTAVERDRIWVIYIVSFFVIFFWSAFEQAGASLTYFAEEQTERRINLFQIEIPASFFQSVNAIAIVIFAPLFSIVWTRLGNRGLEPASVVKQAFGLLLLALGFLLIAVRVRDLDPSAKVSMFWLTALYVIHTWGELCLSPIGLSLVSKLAPARFASLLMGVWFLANATASNIGGLLSALYPPSEKEFQKAAKLGIDLPAILNHTVAPTDAQLKQLEQIGVRASYPELFGMQIHDLFQFFMIFVVTAGLASLLLMLLSRKLIRMMHGIR